MYKIVLASAVLLVLALAQPSASTDLSPESLRGSQAADFDKAAGAIPVPVAGTDLRCEARLLSFGNGYRAMCPFGMVVTGVTLSGGAAMLNCSQIAVTCK